ncbi:hypothetical protein AJ79_08970 [Helicocarpus griseus UAMH5409]|uniref:Peptidase S7 domain-containing protein n=1 Tax=Helicocarpus griseus UAMH5409 TaxID=1447875 RepID=A0A2B7WNT2_9EURO|nr:hypothetical protein AJ79_08970 [Helicocarpus griseus UAMH5409]
MERYEEYLTIKDIACHFPWNKKDYLGNVFAASGCRVTETNQPQQLDWALIEIGSRWGINMLPSCKEHSRTSIYQVHCMILPPMELPKPGDPLFKVGRTISFKEDRYNGLPSIILEEGATDSDGHNMARVTYEHAVSYYGYQRDQFFINGDAGSVVFDRHSAFVGILFAGKEQGGIGYFTPIETVLEDIKRITGAQDIRIPFS